MNTDDGMTYAERKLRSMLEAGGEVTIGESRRAAMRERVLDRVLAAGSAAPAPVRKAARAATGRSFTARLIAVATAVSVFGSSAVAYAAEGAMPQDALYPVKRAMQTAALAVAPTASIRAGLAIRMADDRVAEAADVASSDPELANELAREARETLYEAAAQAGGMSGEARDDVVARLIAIGARQREHLMQIAARLPDAAQAGIMRAIARAGGEARARAIEVHLARAERRAAARVKVRNAEHARGAGQGAGQGRGAGIGGGSGKGAGGQGSDGQGADEQHRPPDAGEGRADPDEQGQGQGKGAGGGESGGGSSGRGGRSGGKP
jgi:uncharacterized membrane protein YgcG